MAPKQPSPSSFEDFSAPVGSDNDEPQLPPNPYANLDPENVKGFMDNVIGVADQLGLDANSSSYFKAFKGMIGLWNPKQSAWAQQASKDYRKLLRDRIGFPPAWKPLTDKESTMRKVQVEQCGCQRTVRGHKDVMVFDRTEGNSSISTCSKHSYLRGFKQRIIGFSFYGDPNSPLGKFRKYFQGIKDNLELVPKFYDGWNIRLYYDLEEDSPLMSDLCDLACSNSNIDLCHVKKIPLLGDVSKVFAMNWRFLPMIDPQVTHLVSRDLDSLINEREAAAVKEWLDDPEAAFHFMRDHPAHSIEILGSGWGVRLGDIERQMADDAFNAAVKDPLFWAQRKAYGPDQGFLKR